MGVYIAEFITILLFGGIFKSKQAKKTFKDNNKAFLISAIFILTVIMAIREPHLGTDSWMYGTLFLRIGQAGNSLDAMKASTFTAPLYVLVCRMLFRLSDSRQILIIASAIAVNLCYYNFIKRESKDYRISVLLYMTLAFYFQSFNGTRQYISVGLIINAFSYWSENRKSIKGWIFFICGVLIHSTGIIGLVYLLLVGTKKDDKEKAIARGILIAVICALGETVLLTLFTRLFPQYNSYFDTSLGHYYYDNSGEGRQVLVVLVYLVFVIYAIFQMLQKKKHHEDNNVVINQLSPMIISVAIGFMGANSWAISRVNFYFTSLAICFIPNTLTITGKYNRINKALKVLTVAVTAVYGFMYLYEDKAGIIPFSVFWGG